MIYKNQADPKSREILSVSNNLEGQSDYHSVTNTKVFGFWFRR
jgi:hypothetical protein